ncbi:MAG: hypothetical protein GY801_50320 [bacterium]|nr:hypothetical protein [bacterium]
MTQVTIKSATADQVRPLVQVALEHELRVLNIGIQKTMRNLQRLEERFGMESQQFYQEFQTGTMGDEMEYITWAGEYETLLQLQEDYAELEQIQVC